MPVYDIKGNLLDTKAQFICHQVNCQGRMGSGVAKAIRDKWPIVYTEYRNRYEEVKNNIDEMCGRLENGGPDVSEALLGTTQFVVVDNHKTVVNMFAQQYYGYDGKRYTSYDAFWQCLNHIKEFVPKGKSIAFPCKIGCGLGGANWNIIRTMIEEVLGYDYPVFIFELEEEK